MGHGPKGRSRFDLDSTGRSSPKNFRLKSPFIKAFFTSVKFSVKMKNYTCKKGLLNWVSLFRGLAWRGTALRRCSEGPQWRAWVFCAHAVFLVAPPSSSQAAKVKETLKNLEWIGNLTRFNLTIFFSSKYRSDKSQPISVNCSEIRKFVNWKQVLSECNDLTCFSCLTRRQKSREKIAVEWKSSFLTPKNRDLNLSTFTPD